MEKYDGLVHWKKQWIGDSLGSCRVWICVGTSEMFRISTMNRNSRLKFPILRLGLNILHDQIETQDVFSPLVVDKEGTQVVLNLMAIFPNNWQNDGIL